MRNPWKKPKKNPEHLRKDALALVCMAIRGDGGAFEALQSGEYPASAAGDYSDVRIAFPGGELPWAKAARISDEEMESIARSLADNLYTLLLFLERNPDISLRPEEAGGWELPKVNHELMAALEEELGAYRKRASRRTENGKTSKSKP